MTEGGTSRRSGFVCRKSAVSASSTVLYRVFAAAVSLVLLFGPAGTSASNEIDVLRNRIYAWSKAWQSRDIDAYMSFYSPSFRSQGLDYMGWGLKKTKLFSKPENITVEISDLWVFIEGKRAIAWFVQQYARAAYTDSGEKTLVLEKANSKWKIVSEVWHPLPGNNRRSGRPTFPNP